VFGGAVFTLLQGGLADILGSWRWTWMLNTACELIILYYALFGYRIKDKDGLRPVIFKLEATDEEAVKDF
jgi:FHS family L-fucose permease-like MFS transporter